jgi:uncharacterized SAM-binding protein YcdF (DUF218 family)
VPLDAIVLLGCRIGPGGRPSEAALRRAAAAARAWHEQIAPLVVVSGGRRWAGVSEAEALGRELVRLGVEAEAIVPELCSLSTQENARYTARIVRARGLSRVAVVTCDWHLPRALVCFHGAGIDALGIPAPSPPASRILRLRRAARERIGQLLDNIAGIGGLEPP